MIKQPLVISAMTSTLLFSAGLALAADQATPQERMQAQEREQIYGSHLMTPQERIEYHNRIRSAKTAQEREQIRQEHHKNMTERAKARGQTLPDMPPANGNGMGPGYSGGMGPGGMGR